MIRKLKNNIQNTNRILAIFLLSFLFFTSSTNAQVVSSTEIGIMAGGSYYLGDINSNHFDYMMPSGGIVVRKNIDRRITMKGELLLGYIRANDNRNTNDTSLLNRNLHFRSPIYELSGQVEFNFLPYETGNSLYPWTPFIFAGVSLFRFNPQAEANNGEWVDLQPLGTEGQGTTSFPDRKKYALTQFSIPMGGGVKIAVNKTFNIIIEYGIRKTFTDYLDDISTTYTGQNLIDMSTLAIEMSDRNIDTKNSDGDPYKPWDSQWQSRGKDTQRGNSKNNDWYTFTGITLSFKLLSETTKCNY
ncbi:MAG: hypothetical protein H8E84_06355 [Flavobacteriales bacterium]|nr:hypothetical protein [Flavobacteriales bacterium]